MIITIFLYLGDALGASQLIHSSQGRWAEGSAVPIKTEACAEPREVSGRTHSIFYTLESGVQG